MTELPSAQTRTLRLPDAIEQRRSMLNEPHIAPLTNYVKGLRQQYSGLSEEWEFQDFDPLDGGCEADILFLMEKPGPMTSDKSGKGSGFISRDNDDPTAVAIFDFMNKAGIPRKRTVLWNVIPGWNGTRKIKAIERKNGLAELDNLISLLPKLKTVVLVGKHAGKAKEHLSKGGFNIIQSMHPSPIVRATHRSEWEAIPVVWGEAIRYFFQLMQCRPGVKQ